MATRRSVTAGLSLVMASLLSSCGTIIYPDRVNQKNRGNLDPTVIILDGLGCFLFLIPGIIAFAVDFSTGAIYFPEGQGRGDEERTIFDELSMVRPEGKLNQQSIERIVSEHAGIEVNLASDAVQVVELDHVKQFWMAYSKLSSNTCLT